MDYLWILLYRFHRIYVHSQEKLCKIILTCFLNDYKKSDKIIYRYFKDKYGREGKYWFRLRKIDETRNYLLQGIKHNNLISEKYKKTYNYLNYVENLALLSSTITGCVSISTFASLVCAICAIIAGIKKY